MVKIGQTIIEDGLINQKSQIIRKTARAIILNNDQQVLMAYSSYFNDYMFPGGGIHEYEDNVDALIREMKEELGAKNLQVIKPFGYTEEIRFGCHKENLVFNQISHYYLCEIDGLGKQQLKGNELQYGVEPKWVNIEDVIQHNLRVVQDDKHQKKGLKTVLLRENQVLAKLKEIINEKI